MEGKPKVTKEVLCEESRFILANVMAESKYGRQNRYEDIRRVCEGAVSIPFTEYVAFLVSAGYLRHDRTAETLEVTGPGEDVVNGGSLSELTVHAVSHFKSIQANRRRKKGEGSGPERNPISERNPIGERYPENRSHSSEVLDSRYEKLATIGSGGIGTVYRARQVPLNRQVALKEVRDLFSFFAEEQRPEIIRRFTEVVRAAANLAHPERSADSRCESRPGTTRTWSPSCVPTARPGASSPTPRPFRLRCRSSILVQTLHALQAGHKEGVVHRSLKPENMLIDAYGNVKVSDFGFARIVERDQNVIRQVYVGMGTVAYMAP